MTDHKTQIIVLAAGKGKRMNSELPKVLVPLKGKPLVKHLLEAIEQSGVCAKPVLVVGQKKEMVIAELGDTCNYAVQDEQLGTGHAVNCAREKAIDADQIIVLYGDHPYVSPTTIVNLTNSNQQAGSMITIATAIVPDFADWRAGFFDFGRIVRDDTGAIVKIVEKKDSTESELQIKEINPAYFCFNAKWLWEHLPILKNNNAQGEYYLTDLIALAQNQNHPINSISIEPHEALGVNTAEQLERLEKIALV